MEAVFRFVGVLLSAPLPAGYIGYARAPNVKKSWCINRSYLSTLQTVMANRRCLGLRLERRDERKILSFLPPSRFSSSSFYSFPQRGPPLDLPYFSMEPDSLPPTFIMLYCYKQIAFFFLSGSSLLRSPHAAHSLATIY